MFGDDRTNLLLGEAKIKKLAKAHILILGVGGVGGYAAEMLVRSGVGELTLVDGDTAESTNLNRQIAALHSTLGKPKTEILAARFLDINPKLKVHSRVQYIAEKDVAPLLDAGKFDFAVDAIDSVGPKTAFILECLQRHIPLASSMGSGGKLDGAEIIECDIAKTTNCGLARAVRRKLREAGVFEGVRVVFSPEIPHKNDDRTVGTISYLPAIFGCRLAEIAIKSIISK